MQSFSLPLIFTVVIKGCIRSLTVCISGSPAWNIDLCRALAIVFSVRRVAILSFHKHGVDYYASVSRL